MALSGHTAILILLTPARFELRIPCRRKQTPSRYAHEYVISQLSPHFTCENVMAVNTANRMLLPNKTPPISPNETGTYIHLISMAALYTHTHTHFWFIYTTLLRVSTKSKNVYSEIRAIADSNPVENKSPPL